MRTTALLLLLSLGTFAQSKTAAKRPNIVFIFSDDHAYQAISAYGNKLVQTPNIDRIAQGGVLFRNALVTNSICGPSRATLITGKYSHMNGYKANEGKFDVTQMLFPRVLQQHDYQTAWIGKWHLGSLPEGFDYWRILPGQGFYYNPNFIEKGKDTARVGGYVTDLITDFSVDWIKNRDSSKPFFLVVAHKATHREWQPDTQDLGAYDHINFPLPSNFYDDYKDRIAAKNQDMTIDKTMRMVEDLKVHVDWQRKTGLFSRMTPAQQAPFQAYYEGVTKDFDEKKPTGKALAEWKFQRYMKDYLATARSLDRNIGRLLDYIDASGLAENTVVIYASDQGFYMGEHGWFDKRFIYDESMRTAFMMRYPGVIKPGTQSDALMANIDWAPTMLDIAGVKAPADIQGRSFLPLVKTGSKNPAWRDAVYYHYYEYPEPHHVYPHFGLRSKQYTLVHFYGETDSWELYDLKKDPTQQHNVYKDAKYQQVIGGLKKQLKGLIEEYKDEEAMKVFNSSRS
ncbi:sulfatase [uncultured Chitinophaga sp.]|uniref:sulfatase family protein n=1 Tax=uncultured Chitinophaga sp. TaxID=339340 RepID=UPI0025E5172F|nr:sulfatase [uncultured Chitinophaga sp.]